MNNSNPLLATLISFIFLLFGILVAAAVIFWVDNCWRTKPDGTIARLVRHRDRIWFALLLAFVAPVGISILTTGFMYQFGYNQQKFGSSMMTLELIVRGFSMVLNGAIYGVAGCFLASPAKKEKPFNFWLVFAVAATLPYLIHFINILYNLYFQDRGNRYANPTDISAVPAAVIILAFIVSRAFGRKDSKSQQESATKGASVGELAFDCPHCSRRIASGGIQSGEQIYCPGCGKTMLVPPQSEWWQRASEAEAEQPSRQSPIAEKGLGLGDFLKKALLIIATVVGLALVVLAILFAACAAMLQHV